VIRVFDAAGNVIQTHEQAGEFKEFAANVQNTFRLKITHRLLATGNTLRPSDADTCASFGLGNRIHESFLCC
jgi:hypothetical protein